jgi:energy-coupling factor transport system ATP-binding protein
VAQRLTLDEVSYSYPLPGREDAPAVTGVSFSVEPGEIFCIAGANGSGKSTLAQICAGLLAPGSGSVVYGDGVVGGRTGLREFRRRVGLVFQSPEDQLFADTVSKDIAFGPRNHGLRGEELAAAVSRAADLVGLPLEQLGDRSPFSLSEGEKRRVALAGVLALNPDILLLDEPFIGLDYDGRERLKNALATYREERDASMIIVTHELSDVWPLASRFALLAEGRLRRFDRRGDLLSSEFDLSELGMRLPQWGVLARELLRSGIPLADPADPRALARAIAAHREARGDR